MMKKLSLVFALLMIGAALPAAGDAPSPVPAAPATVLCRSGELLAAEFTTRVPGGAVLDPCRYPDLPKKRIFAAVTLRPAPGRGVGIYDYTMRAFDRDMPCIGMDFDGEAIDPTLKTVPPERLAGGKRCTLYFVLDGSLLGFKKVEAVILRCNFAPEAIRDQRILLINRGDDAFTPSRSIPAAGIMATRPQ